MTSADFEAQLRQSVADHIALVHASAKAAKARIGTTMPQPAAAIAAIPEADPLFDEPPAQPQRRGPAVNFLVEEELPAEPVPDAEAPAADALPDGAIAFDDFGGDNVDDEGIPVWEDPL